MTETTTEDASTLEDGGAMELVRVPAWKVEYTRGEDPDELAHIVCCRDLDWRKTMCGYEDPAPAIVMEADSICTMCVEAVGGADGPLNAGRCPIDDRPCPDFETVARWAAERTSRQ